MFYIYPILSVLKTKLLKQAFLTLSGYVCFSDYAITVMLTVPLFEFWLGMEVMHERNAHNFPLDLPSVESVNG